MDKKYLEMTFLWGAHNYVDLKIVLELEKKYAIYKNEEGWDNLSIAVGKYVEGLNEDELIEFINEYIIMLQNSKLQDNLAYEVAFIGIILGFLYGGFIYDTNKEHSKQMKEFIFGILDSLESGKNAGSYVFESVVSYRHMMYRGYKGLSHEEYGKLIKEKFKDTEGYEGIYRWYGEFLD